MKKIIGWGFCWMVFLTQTESAWSFSSSSLDANATGADQSFSLGYDQRAFSESFHERETYAVQKLRIPKNKWTVSKSVSAAATYDGNVLNSRQVPKDDMVYTYSPTISIKRRMKYMNLHTFYTMSYSDHVEFHKSNHMNHVWGTSFDYRKNKWSWSISNSFQPDSVFSTGQRSELDAGGTGRVLAYADNLTTEIGYKFTDRTTGSFQYGLGVFYFPVEETSTTVNGMSTITHKFIPKLSYRVAPKTNIDIMHTYEKVDYYLGGLFSSYSNATTIGMDGKINAKTSMDVNVGYKKRNFTNSTASPVSGLVLNSAINRKLSPKISGSVSWSRETSENFDALEGLKKQQTTTTYGVNLSYAALAKLRFDAFSSLVSTANEGMITLVDIENPKLTFTRVVEDWNFEWGGAMSWAPRSYWSFLLGFKRYKKNSTFKDFEYDGQRYVLQGNVKF